MKKLLVLLVLVLVGCASTMPNMRPTPLMVEPWSPQATVSAVPFPAPLLWVQVGGANTYGMFSYYYIRNAVASQGRGDGWWPYINGEVPEPPRLTLQLGQSLTLEHDQATAPTFLVIELDEQNHLLHAAVLPAPQNQYTPVATGFFRLSVRAQWNFRYHITYYFNLEVKP